MLPARQPSSCGASRSDFILQAAVLLHDTGRDAPLKRRTNLGCGCCALLDAGRRPPRTASLALAGASLRPASPCSCVVCESSRENDEVGCLVRHPRAHERMRWAVDGRRGEALLQLGHCPGFAVKVQQLVSLPRPFFAPEQRAAGSITWLPQIYLNKKSPSCGNLHASPPPNPRRPIPHCSP